jgi:hypothetical protein
VAWLPSFVRTSESEFHDASWNRAVVTVDPMIEQMFESCIAFSLLVQRDAPLHTRYHWELCSTWSPN